MHCFSTLNPSPGAYACSCCCSVQSPTSTVLLKVCTDNLGIIILLFLPVWPLDQHHHLGPWLQAPALIVLHWPEAAGIPQKTRFLCHAMHNWQVLDVSAPLLHC
jgi:hypothetical protein